MDACIQLSRRIKFAAVLESKEPCDVEAEEASETAYDAFSWLKRQRQRVI